MQDLLQNLYLSGDVLVILLRQLGLLYYFDGHSLAGGDMQAQVHFAVRSAADSFACFIQKVPRM